MIVDFNQKINEISEKDSRYKPDAYGFIIQALRFTQERLERKGHITAKELLEGIKEYGLEQYGPMTKTVFGHWGITTTEDFGEIVFNMVENKLMGKNEKDSCDDFRNVYDFGEVFDSRKQFRINK